MIRPPYQQAPHLWNNAQRTSHTPAESACAIEGPMPKTSKVVAAIFKWALAVIAAPLVVALIARLA